MSERRDARALDRALSGKRSSGSAQVLALATVAQALQGAFDVEVPAARTTRSTFIQGVGGRGRSWGWLRVFAPATVTALILLIAMFAGRTALPGETLYPVRQVLKAVGLAPITVEEIDGQIAEARELLEDAQRIVADRPQQAKGMAFEAVKLLGFAEELLPEVSADAAKSRAPLLNSLLARAMQVLEVDGSPTDDPRGSDDDQQGALRRDDEGEDDDEGDDDDRSGDSGRAGDGRDASDDNRGSDRDAGSDGDQRTGNSGPRKGEDEAPDPEDDATLGDGDTNNGGNEGPGDGDDDTNGDDEKDDDDADDDTKGDDEERDDEKIPGAEEVLRGEGRSGGAGHGGGANDDDDNDAKNKLNGDDDREKDDDEDDDDTRDDLEINEDELLAI